MPISSHRTFHRVHLIADNGNQLHKTRQIYISGVHRTWGFVPSEPGAQFSGTGMSPGMFPRRIKALWKEKATWLGRALPQFLGNKPEAKTPQEPNSPHRFSQPDLSHPPALSATIILLKQRKPKVPTHFSVDHFRQTMAGVIWGCPKQELSQGSPVPKHTALTTSVPSSDNAKKGCIRPKADSDRDSLAPEQLQLSDSQPKKRQNNQSHQQPLPATMPKAKPFCRTRSENIDSSV